MNFPATFGRYQLIRPLAVGGMAEVFLARSFGVEGFEKRLVIKRILPAMTTNPRFVDLFIQEAKLLASLNHPNIVSVYELGKVGDEHYIAMEQVQGRDLVPVLRALRLRNLRLKPHLAVGIAVSVARALAYAHGLSDVRRIENELGPPEPTPSRSDPSSVRSRPDAPRIVHRDVSPHNVVVSFEGDVKLIDFGIAKVEGSTLDAGGGKFSYMSPEQAAGSSLDGRSDLYSLGVLLFELLTSHRPYAEGDTDDRRRDVLAAAVRPLSTVIENAPAGLEAILARLLARDPDDRYPNADAAENDLRTWLFENGHHTTTAELGGVLRDLFSEELASEGTWSGLDGLARDLEAMHTDVPLDRYHAAPSVTPHTKVLPGPAQGERRSVVVLVAEVSGLTELSSRADGEVVGRVHFRLLRMVRRLLDRFDGNAEKYDDDTLVVVFGLPRAHGDDVDRALLCAQDLQRLSVRLRRRGINVEFSIGIHVGEITVGRRAGRHWRFAPRGDTLKAGVRLAYAAEPGAVLVSDRVVALAGDRFAFEGGSALRRKGSRGSRSTFALTGVRAGGRVMAGRWYRRGDEWEILRAAVGELKEGRGARIALIGELGIGKSRLNREFRELVTRWSIPVYQARALPYGPERPFSSFRALLSDVLGIRPETGADGIRERLARLPELGLIPREAQALRSLYAVELGERREPTREHMLAAAGRIVGGLAADGPIVILLEDIEHLDSLERLLLQRLVEAAATEPVLVLVSWRGSCPTELEGKFQEVPLGPLTSAQTLALAAELLDAEACGPDLSRLVQRTAEGNPLYLDEILRALQRAGRIWYEERTVRLRDPEVDPGLPDSLHGLIAARIDQLDEDERAVLQMAAVVGVHFSPELLRAAADADLPPLDGLQRAGLIAPEGLGPESPWRFCSVLVWECVGRSITAPLRREYHRLAAEGLERLHGAMLDTVIEAYGHHCYAAGRSRDAARAMLRAGDQDRRAQLLERALQSYTSGLRWLESASRDQRDDRLEATLRVAAGEVAVLLGLPSAAKNLEVALDIAGEAGFSEVETRAMLTLGQLHLARGQASIARNYLELARGQARRAHEAVLEVAAIEGLGTLALDEGRVDDARVLYEEGRRVAGEDRALAARMLLGLSRGALQRADRRLGRELLELALPLAETSGDRILLGRVVNNLGIAFFQEGRFHEALAEFQRALELRRGIGYRQGEVINLHNIGDAHLHAGNLALAFAAFEQSRDLARSCGWEQGVVTNEVQLCFLRGQSGEPVAEALEHWSNRARQLGDAQTTLVARWLAARLLARTAAGVASARIREIAQDARTAGFDDLADQIGEA